MMAKKISLTTIARLTAATTNYIRATHKDVYQAAAEKRANNLIGRLASWQQTYKNYWRADDKDRPFFHAADAGLPVVSLLNATTPWPVARKYAG